MEWDCKISALRTIHQQFCVFFVLLCIACRITAVTSLFLDCDKITGNRSCMCSKLDDYQIECPFSDPIAIQLKLYDRGENNESGLIINCNFNSVFQWKLIKDVNLSEENIRSKITKLSIEKCLHVEDGFDGLIERIKLNPQDLKTFNFISYQNISSLPENFLKNFVNVSTLNLSDNKLLKIPNIEEFALLEELNFRANPVTSINPATFRGNKRLKRVNLRGHAVEKMNVSVFPSTLEFLEFSSTKLKSISNSTFSNLQNLSNMILENAPLYDCDVHAFDNLQSLEHLWINRVKFKTIPTFSNLPSLKNLTMNGALIKSGNLSLANLSSLSKFQCNACGLRNLPVFTNVTSLRFIELKMNKISSLEKKFFENVPSMTTLNLARNEIVKLGAINSPSLQIIQLNDNKLEEISDGDFMYLGRLRELYLQNNKISKVGFRAFENLGNLRVLDLSHNELLFNSNPYQNITTAQDAFFGAFGNASPLRNNLLLKILNLSHNKITRIFDDWRNILSNLETLDLSYNKLKYISAVDLNFVSSRGLKINLIGNEITSIDLRNSFIYLNPSPKAINYYLNENPIKCDCLAYHLREIQSKSHIFHIEALQCAAPPSLRKMRLLEVPKEELICQLDARNGCPTETCTCWERPVDSTLVINCSNLNLTSNDLPDENSMWSFNKKYGKWGVDFDFSGNKLTEVKDTQILSLPDQTKFVNFSGNYLSNIGFLNQLGDTTKINFSFSSNPFSCDQCLDFVVVWATLSSRIVDSDNITCLQQNGDALEKLTVHDVPTIVDDCNNVIDSSDMRVLIICLAVLLALLVVVLIAFLRYSWVIKAYLFSKGLGWCLFWDSDMDADDKEKLYDAFVSYSHKDEDWVLEELVERLEAKEGFKLCLHFRDWTPGDWIPDQIVKSVDQSKRTVVVLSKNFVDSVWSRLEFKAAHAQALSQNTNKVILVLIEEGLTEEDVKDDDLKVYMKMNTYLKWNDPWFWHKLKYALPHKKSNNDGNQDLVQRLKNQETAKELDKIRIKLEENKQ